MKIKLLLKSLLPDLLMAAALLLIFAFIHHGFSWIKVQLAQSRNNETATLQLQAEAETVPAAVEEGTDEQSAPVDLTVSPEAASGEADPEENAAEPEQEAEEPDNRTEWQIKFAEHFTDEVVITENSYSSPDISVTIDTVVRSEEDVAAGQRRLVYYVADIYIGSIDCLKRCIANDSFELYSYEDPVQMDVENNAVIGMTGDFISLQYDGIEVINGVTERSAEYTSADLCVLYYDGTMETPSQYEYDREALLNSGTVWNLWHFGPALLTDDGEIPTSYHISESVTYRNPRSAFGYYEPGHYCFVVVDGRQSDWSEGVTLSELSLIFYDLGCKAAYNMDGGGSALMTFNDEIYNRQSEDRQMGDMILICEPAEAAGSIE